MVKESMRCFGVIIIGLCCAGCNMAAQQPVNDEYPPPDPIWIVEDDPDETIFDRKDLERDRKVGKILVIPLYEYYQHEGETDFLAIAHPFVYEQGTDIEKHLASFEQRDKLHRLIFWVPGYFPDGLGRAASWSPIINGKRMDIVELQRCVGSEEKEINDAMKTLLMGGGFKVGKGVILEVPPIRHDVKSSRLTGELRTPIEPYDAKLVVRTMEYNGRFYDDGGVLHIHVLWGFPPGTKIANRLSAEDKKIVAEFAEHIPQTNKNTEKKNEQGSKDREK